MQTLSNRASLDQRTRWQLLLLAVALQLSHFLVLCLLPHPGVASNFLQLGPPLLVIVVGFRQRKRSRNSVIRRNWNAVIASFAIWMTAQSCFLYFMFFPLRSPALVRPDDALWVVFILPLLLATILTQEEVDHIGWLDRLQVLLFFAVLYLLFFLPSIRLNMDVGFLIQDLALALCCLVRLPACQNPDERRFFIRVMLFMVVYGVLATTGDVMHAHGMLPGSLIDLVWTLPDTVFLWMILSDEPSISLKNDVPKRLLSVAREAQGLGIAAVAFLSIAVSALLTMHKPTLGGICAFAGFALFALRTNARERTWHHAHERLEKTALHDSLTGLGNRMMLRRRLEERLHSRSDGFNPILVFADLDRFKTINDSLGHALGDQLLIAVAQRLRAAAPSGAVVCRHGGDEFVLLATSANPQDAGQIGQALLEALRPAYQLNGHSLHCTASIGVVLAEPGETADELLRTADHAMYRAKQLGKDCVQLFDAGLRNQLSQRWQMEAELRRCLETDGLDVAFQPILSVEGNAITGFEALARWNHPVYGSVPPAEFIPLAEESGMILLLGAQMLEKACRQVALWNALWRTELTLSVNVSPRQFADANLLTVVLQTLERTRLPASLLQLEITETALIVNQALAKEILSAARSHGIGISLDDFGTGYSSLAFLLNLPVDEVKVDRSFVSEMRSDPHRKELVRAVVKLGQSLGKRVVAEGVETEDDLRELAAMGCECAQGWLIGRPMSAEATEAGLPSIAPLSRKTAEPKRNLEVVPRTSRGMHFPPLNRPPATVLGFEAETVS